MTDTTVAPAGDELDVDPGHAHPGDTEYYLVALGLAAVTGIEVAVYYLKQSDITVGVFMVLMLIKFATVVGYFMHLRFDSPALRRLFVGGLSLAVSVYVIFLLMFGVLHF